MTAEYHPGNMSFGQVFSWRAAEQQQQQRQQKQQNHTSWEFAFYT